MVQPPHLRPPRRRCSPACGAARRASSSTCRPPPRGRRRPSSRSTRRPRATSKTSRARSTSSEPPRRLRIAPRTVAPRTSQRGARAWRQVRQPGHTLPVPVAVLGGHGDDLPRLEGAPAGLGEGVGEEQGGSAMPRCQPSRGSARDGSPRDQVPVDKRATLMTPTAKKYARCAVAQVISGPTSSACARTACSHRLPLPTRPCTSPAAAECRRRLARRLATT